MSINKKSKPNGAVESSSDDEKTISTVNTKPTKHASTPDSHCSICLDILTNRCNTNSCLHLFCFECLQRWSNSAQFCPLCRKTFNYIYHSFDDLGVHETYNVPIQVSIWEGPQFGNEQIFRNPLSMADLVRFLYTDNSMNEGLSAPISERSLIGIEMRTFVYATNGRANPLPDSTGRSLDCSSAFYRANPSHVQRLYVFILRDIIAVRESLRTEGQPLLIPNVRDALATHYIMESLLTHEIRQLHLLIVLRHVLDLHAAKFCNELYNFASSPYDVRDYDDNVYYTFRLYDNELTEPLPSETSLLNSDNEEFQRSVITTNVRSIEPRISASIPVDQPSTSTGIRDTLNRTNNRFQSVDSDSFLYLSHLKRQRTYLDFSSDDEDSIIATRGSKTAHIKSRVMINKKKGKKKLKLTPMIQGPESPVPTETVHVQNHPQLWKKQIGINSYYTDVVL